MLNQPRSRRTLGIFIVGGIVDMRKHLLSFLPMLSGRPAVAPPPRPQPRHGKAPRLLVALLALVATLAGSGVSLTAYAAPMGHNPGVNVPPPRGKSWMPPIHTALTTCPAGTLCNNGGPVQDHPKVYLLFWGDHWTNTSLPNYGTYSAIMSHMTDLFDGLAGGNYNNILAQYTGNRAASANYVHSDSVLAGTAVDTTFNYAATLTMTDIGNEAAQAIVDYGWTNTVNTQVLVFPQDGATYGSELIGACGVHGYGSYGAYSIPVTFAVVRYSGDIVPAGGCNAGGATSIVDTMTVTASHEYAEIATDPQPSTHPAWRASDGQEIADLCRDYAHQYQPMYGPSYNAWIQELWSNADNGCTWAVGSQYAAPVAPYQHTVQNAILSRYLGSCGIPSCSTVLGAPLTEEIPTISYGTSGTLSYFAAGCFNARRGPQNSCSGIYSSTVATGAKAIWSGAFIHYAVDLGGSDSLLGYPTTDTLSITGGTVTYFRGWGTLCNGGGPNSSGGAIYQASGYNAYEVHGCIEQYYEYTLGGATGSFKFPVSDEVAAGSGRASYFRGSCTTPVSAAGQPYNNSCGGIFYGGSTGTHGTSGPIYLKYMSLGGAASWLGLPTSDEVPISGGQESMFQYGYITYDSSTGATLTHPYNSPGRLVDVNGDFLPEIIAKDPNGNLYVYPHTTTTTIGGGMWGSRILVETNWNNYDWMTLSDLNADGYPDILARDHSGYLWAFPHNPTTTIGTGMWGSAILVGNGWQIYDTILLGYVSDSAYPDIVARDGNGDLWAYQHTASATIGYGGMWNSRVQIGNGWNIYPQLSLDNIGKNNTRTTGDGPELIGIDSTGNLYAYPNLDYGTLNTFGARVQIGNGWNVYKTFLTGDINDDGYTDLLGLDFNGNLYAYPNNQVGTVGSGMWGSRIQVGNGWNTYVQVG